LIAATMSDKSNIPAKEYVAVAPEDQYELTATLVDPSLYLDKPAKTVDSQYANLAELRNITWTDTFFEDDDDVIAVFDFDYDAVEDFYTSVGWVSFGATLLYTPLFVLSLFGLTPCYIRSNVRWNTRAQHVAISRDGIRFVRDKRPCCWGLPCTDQGKNSKTVPFDKITDCDIAEPAGNTCFCITNVLSVVNVDTASSGTDGKKELQLAGVRDPHSFKKLVWAMKRAQQGTAPSSYQMVNRAAENTGDVTSLLREIRDELRTNNELLKSVQPSAPPATMFPVEMSVEAEEPKVASSDIVVNFVDCIYI
jgi:hypothetical protein